MEQLTENQLVFKFKITKRDLPGVGGTPLKTKFGGIYEQITGGTRVYPSGNFSLEDIHKAIGDVFVKDPTKARSITLHTNEAGMKMFQEALQKETNKKAKKDEYRKKLSFRSKVFKQTYKFR